MIVLKISNASELIASKVGGFIEQLTPDSLDDSTVEELVIKKMIENLMNEGITGQISLVRGVEIKEGNMIVDDGFRVSKQKEF